MANGGQGISPTALYAVIWTLASIATLLLLGRLLIRSITLPGFHGDDLFSVIAWVLMIAVMIITTYSTPLSYHFTSMLVGEEPITSPQEFSETAIDLRKWGIAAQTMFWTSLYCVKLSFMSLYRLVVTAMQAHQRVWWVAMVYIVLSYGICLIGVFGQCGDVVNLFSFEGCATPYVAELQARLIWVVYFFNVSSDLVVILLPMPLIWGLHMRPSKKLALSGVCGLAFVTVAFETLRSVKLYQSSFVLVSLYGFLQLLVAVIVGMLPPYRFLLFNSEKRGEYRSLFWYRLTLRSNQLFRSRDADPRPEDTEMAEVEVASNSSASGRNGLFMTAHHEPPHSGDLGEYRIQGTMSDRSLP